jgi:hypothetical protein
VLLYCDSLRRWASDTILDPDLTSFRSLKKFFFFTKLARKCFDLHDYCSSSAILRGLGSKKIRELDRLWKNCDDYSTVRTYWVLSFNQISLVLTPSHSERVNQRFHFELQKKHYQQLATHNELYLCPIGNYLKDIRDRHLFDLHQTLNLSSLQYALERTNIILDGITFKSLNKASKPIDHNLVNALANGPLKIINLITLLSLAKRESCLVTQACAFTELFDCLERVNVATECIVALEGCTFESASDEKKSYSDPKRKKLLSVIQQKRHSSPEQMLHDNTNEGIYRLMLLKKSEGEMINLLKGKLKVRQQEEEFEFTRKWLNLAVLDHGIREGNLQQIVREIRKFPKFELPSQLLLQITLMCEVK